MKNTGLYALTNEKGDPVKYTEELAKQIPGLKNNGGKAFLNGRRIHASLTADKDGAIVWIGVDTLEKLTIANTTVDAAGNHIASSAIKPVYAESSLVSG